MPELQIRGLKGKGHAIRITGAAPEKYSRFVVTVEGRELMVKRNGQAPERFTLPADVPARGALGLSDVGSAMEFMNLYVRDLR